MIELIDNCVDCGLHCLGLGCPYYKRDYVVCDKCGAIIREAYTDEEDSYNLCVRCAKNERSEG